MVTVADVRLLGGHSALDFVNTVENRAGESQELLHDYGDFLAWACRAGLVDAGLELGLIDSARRSDREAAEVVRRAIAFREALYAVLIAAIGGRLPDRAALDAVNLEIGGAYAETRLEPVGGSFVLGPRETGLATPLALVARKAVLLLTGSRLERVHRCEGVGDCGWLFLDSSKNGRRRWCSMQGCGSRAKTRRHYARKRGFREEANAGPG
jgi:predicted RNA-binding Zn ribbon-like protein